MDSDQNPTPPTIQDGPGPGSTPISSLPRIPGYDVEELIGRGGMGRVYRARHVALGRLVAIKVLANEPDERLLVRFREEARAVARLQHPNIAQLYETGVADGRPFYAQEFVDGGSLAQAIRGQPQDPLTAARLVEAIAKAIQFSHENGILHRDLKPANILLHTDDGGRKKEERGKEASHGGDPSLRQLASFEPKVTDFGLAKAFSATPASDTAVDTGGGLTRTGEVLGTPAYMPPEQASGVMSSVGPTADVYGLGAILYELLTGRPPFQSPEPLQTMLMVLSTDPVPPRTLQPKVPRDLETICLKCLEKQPRKRYASARELADDLRRFLNREPILARPVGLIERTGKWAKRRPWQAGVVALVSLGVVGLGVGLVILAEKNRQVRHANEQLAAANADLIRSNEQLQQANAETERTLTLSLFSLDRYFFVFSDRLRELPRGGKLRREVLDNARDTLSELSKFRPNDWAIQEYQMEGFNKLGGLEAELGNLPAAEADYVKARDIAAVLEARFPDFMPYRCSRVLIIAKIAGLYLRRGDNQTHDALLDSVTPTLQALVAEHPENIRVLEIQTVIEGQFATRDTRHLKWDAVERGMRELCRLRRKLVVADPTNPKRTLDVIDADTRLAILLIDLKRLDEAGPVLAQAQEAVAKLAEPHTLAARKLRAYVQATAGDYYDRRGESAKAVAELGAAASTYETLAAEFPDSPSYLYDHADTLSYLGWACIHDKQIALGLKHLERALELATALTKAHETDAAYRSLYTQLVADLAQFKKPVEKKP